MIRKIITHPDSILTKVSEPVSEINDDIRQLLEDMAETMRANTGVGLAAPQVGLNIRVVVLDVDDEAESKKFGLIKMINPRIVAREEEIHFEEGCLSVPNLRVTTSRSARICVCFLDENGKSRELTAEGLLAVAIQHEIDHLDGKLIIDHLSRLKRDLFLKKQKKSAN